MQYHSSWASQCGSRQGREFSKVSRDWSFWAPARPQRREAVQNGVPMSCSVPTKSDNAAELLGNVPWFFLTGYLLLTCPAKAMSFDFWGQGPSSLRPVLSAIPEKLMTSAHLGIAHARVSLGPSFQTIKLKWNLFLPKKRRDLSTVSGQNSIPKKGSRLTTNFVI